MVNDPLSSWIGPINPGTTSVAAGSYQYRTRFSLDGFSPASARITMNIGVDDRLSDVLLNGASKGIASSGFAALTGDLSAVAANHNAVAASQSHSPTLNDAQRPRKAHWTNNTIGP